MAAKFNEILTTFTKDELRELIREEVQRGQDELLEKLGAFTDTLLGAVEGGVLGPEIDEP